MATILTDDPSLIPLTEQVAILTVLHGLLPALVTGIGPQWGRFQAIESDAANLTTKMTFLFNSILPPIFNDAYDTFPQVSSVSSDRHNSVMRGWVCTTSVLSITMTILGDVYAQ